MAQLIRSAKSGSDWSDNELFAFNILIQDVDAATFFGTPQLPATTVSPIILNNVARPPAPAVVTKDERIFFEFLDRANVLEKAAVDDLAGHILRMLDFDGNERSITTKRELSFTMCGTRVRATADIAITESSKYSLMVREDKRSTVVDEPVPQLVAEAIAAFVENNRLRRPTLAQQTIPAITMVGPRPIFYKVPVTQALVSALITGEYPAQPTVVQRLVPPVPDEEAYMIHGMNPLADRHIVFQCLEAMRGLL
ncbi:hypothetical protein FIBSPDRAFT_802949 [Athelia psychrophila]|uniref:Uncharacterized protein n=1 Tax=Athelia psychrophila TaxID=1759441 RepID=A0A165XHJ8_9AGAM|nr:hypothetical protein FIBSPDRAFT_802949 [Fibularhizoctonia sp. CBS 109695]